MATTTVITTSTTTSTTMTTTTLPANKRQHKQRQRDAQTRPGRSNSLQRMLELEKQCVLERRHAVRASPSAPKMQPTSSTSMMMQPAPRPTTHSRQYSAEQRKHFLEESVSGQLRMQQSRPAPLKISTHVNGATPRTNTTSTTASTDFKSDLPAPYSPPSTVHPKAKPKGQLQPQSSHLSSSSGMLSQPNKVATGPKTVTFHDQPLTSNPSTVVAASSPVEDRNSVCQSPSWEAYARRKREKKHEKDQVDKEAKANSKSKPRRLSKLSHSHSASEPTLPLQQPIQTRAVKFEQQRPEDTNNARRASTIGLPGQQASLPPPSSRFDTKPPPARRARSNSLSSIFRSPFESRRPSLDSNNGGFIGGIKLEHQRLVAYQRALNEEAIGASGDIHPAFRKHTKRSSSPLRFLVPKTGPKDAQDRAYPPISIRTSATAQGLLPPNSEAMPEGRMSRWKAHFGLRTEPKPLKITRSPSADREQNLGAIFSRRNASSPALQEPPSDQMRYSPSMGQMNAITDKAAPLSSNPQQHLAPALRNTARASSPLARSIKNEVDDSRSDVESRIFTTAPPSPPTPSHNTSIRRSLASLSDLNLADGPGSESPRPIGPRRAQTGFSTMDSEKYVGDSSKRARSASRAKKGDPLSIPYSVTNGTTSKRPASRGFMDAARSVLGRASVIPPLPPTPTMPTASKTFPVTSQSRPTSRSKNSPYLLASKDHEMRSASFSNFQTLHNPKRVNDRRKTLNPGALPVANSSEDSYSDDFHGTPDTSRPGSEKVDGFDHIAEARAALERPHSPAFSTSGASAVDLNPVQSAAMKVLAAFPDLPPPTRPGMGRRSDSVSSVHSVLIPRIKQQNGQHKDAGKGKSTKAPKLEDDKVIAIRDLIMSKDESSAAAPWPASYLEAARKAAPAKDATKTPPKSSPKLPAQSAPPVPSIPSSAPPSVKAQSPPRSRKSSDSTADPQTPPMISVNGSVSTGPEGAPLAKMFVECCSCKYYHDMPSKLYEAMNHPEATLDLGDHTEFAGSISMSIKCPWCKHEMTTKCCAGYAAVVYVQERVH